MNVDADGVHLRWNTHGGLNLYPQELKQEDGALLVVLPRRPVTTALPVLLGEVLAEMGLGI